MSHPPHARRPVAPAPPGRVRAGWLLGASLLLAAGTATPADEPGETEPAVPLERLLELPSGLSLAGPERRAGASEPEWRERFRTARDDLERSRTALARSKARLSELAESAESWSLAPPIGAAQSAENQAPISYELRQRINHEKQEVARTERALRDLEVEANLAGVPESWRR